MGRGGHYIRVIGENGELGPRHWVSNKTYGKMKEAESKKKDLISQRILNGQNNTAPAINIGNSDALSIPQNMRTGGFKTGENTVEFDVNNTKKGGKFTVFADDYTDDGIERFRYFMNNGIIKMTDKKVQKNSAGNDTLVWEFEKIKNQPSVENMAKTIRSAKKFTDVTNTILNLTDLLPNPWAYGREVVEAEGNEKATRKILREIQSKLDIDLGV